VVNELLIMSVNGPSMTGRQSLIIRMLILSGPGDLFDGIVVIIRCTSVHVTGVNLNNSVACVAGGILTIPLSRV
jgi:hypothetical protein